MKFIVEVRDYEQGSDDADITTGRIERAVQKMLDKDGSDGVVIVTRDSDADQG